MASSNTSRDVTLTLNLETLGQADVAKLQQALRDLAAEGGEAAPAFEHLAEDVGKLGAQAEALTAFKELTNQVQTLAVAQAEAAAQFGAARSALDAQTTATQEAAAAQRQTVDALTVARQSFNDASGALRVYVAGTDSATKNTAEYRAEVTRLIEAQVAARNAVTAATAAQQQAAKDASAAASDQSKLQSAFDRTAASASSASAALAQAERALNDQGASAQSLGVSIEDVASAEGELVAAFNRGASALNEYNAAQRAVTEQHAFEKVAADAARLNQASEYIRFWEQALEAGGTESQRAAAQAEESANRISSAFKTVGVGSVQQLEQKISEVRAAMQVLQGEAGLTGGELQAAMSSAASRVAELQRQIRAATDSLTTADKAAGAFEGAMGQFAVGNLVAQGVTALVQKIRDLGAAFVEAIVSEQKFTNALNAIYKNTKTTADQLNFLRTTANQSGQSIGDLQSSFVKFSASMKTANIPLDQANALFSALTRAAGTLGLSSDETAGALEALSQMAGKGTVAMEELRQQLGDRLPGALGLVAQGLGISEQQLIKLVESGQLAARDLFPALTKALNSMQGEVNGLSPAWNQLKNALTETAQTIGDAGWADAMTFALKALGVVVAGAAFSFAALAEGVAFFAKALALLGPGVGTFNQRMEQLRENADGAADRLQRLEDHLFGSADAAKAGTAALGQHTTAVSSAAGATETLGAMTLQTKAGLDAQAAATKALANTTGAAGDTFTKFQTTLAENIQKSEAAAQSADRLAKATQVEGQALVQLAQLRGNDQASLDASVAATESNVAALERSAAAHAALAEQLQVERAALVQKAGTDAAALQAVQTKLVALDQEIDKQHASVEQSKAAVEQSKIDLAARQVQAQAYRDNSAAVDSLRQAAEAADLVLQRVTMNEQVGAATRQQVTEATIAAAKAHALYNDALADSVAKIKSVAALEAAERDVTIEQLKAKQAAAEAEAKHSQTLGFTTASIIDQITAVRAQIAVVQAQAQAKAAAAQAEINAANALEDELRKTGNLTDAKLREIEVTKAEAQAKLIAAGASKSVVKGLQDEIDQLYKKLEAEQQSQNTTRNSTGTTDSDTASRLKNADAINTQTNALQKQQGVSSTGLTKSDGSSNGTFNNAIPLDQVYALIAKQRSGSLTTDDLDAAKSALAQAQSALEFLHASIAQSASSVSTGALNTTAGQVTALQEIVQALTQQKNSADAAAAKANAPAPSPSPVPAPAPATATPSSSSHTVTINLGGQATTIGTASAADASALVTLLQQLEQAQGTAA